MDGGYNPDEGEAPPKDAWATVRTYVPVDGRLDLKRAGIDAGVRLVALLGPVGDLGERQIEEADWREAYKRHIGILAVGKRLLVVPSWEEAPVTGFREVITLDPGLAFGTGHHPTTRMCLELLEQLLTSGEHVLDLGCGSGILSIAAARLGAGRVTGLDVDPDAITAAGRNLQGNGVDRLAAVTQGTLPTGAVGREFDLVLANISATVVIELAEHIARATRPGGTVIVSGVVAERRDQVSTALTAAGLSLTQVRQEGDWVAFHATRP